MLNSKVILNSFIGPDDIGTNISMKTAVSAVMNSCTQSRVVACCRVGEKSSPCGLCRSCRNRNRTSRSSSTYAVCCYLGLLRLDIPWSDISGNILDLDLDFFQTSLGIFSEQLWEYSVFGPGIFPDICGNIFRTTLGIFWIWIWIFSRHLWEFFPNNS